MVTKGWAGRLQPLIGPHGGQWTMCARPKQMQPHLVFRKSVFQGPPRLTNVHFGPIRAGNLIHHPRPLVPRCRVFGVNQLVAQSAKWVESHLDVQWPEDPSYCVRQPTDVGQGPAGPW